MTSVSPVKCLAICVPKNNRLGSSALFALSFLRLSQGYVVLSDPTWSVILLAREQQQ